MNSDHGLVRLPIELTFAPDPAPRRRRPTAPAPPVDPLAKGNTLARIPLFRDGERIVVLVDGQKLTLPNDPAAEARAEVELGGMLLLADEDPSSPLAAFAEACYRFGGWPRLAAVQWQLDWLPIALTDVEAAARLIALRPPPQDTIEAMVGPKAFVLRPNAARLLEQRLQLPTVQFDSPPPWAEMLARELRDPTAARIGADPNVREMVIARARRLGVAFSREVGRLRARIVQALIAVEKAAHDIVRARLIRTQIEIVDQGVRLLGELRGKPFYDWEPGEVSAALETPQTQAFTEFQGLLKALDNPARAVQDAQERLFSRLVDLRAAVMLRSAVSGAQQSALGVAAIMTVLTFLEQLYLIEQTPEIQALRKQLSDAQEALAKKLTTHTVRFPVLFRYSVNDLIGATRSLLVQPRQPLYFKLHEALEASDRMLARFEKDQPVSSGAARVPPPNAEGDLYAELARDVAGSVWSYPKVIDQGLKSLLLPADSLAALATENMLAAVAQRAGEEENVDLAVSVAESALTLGVGVVCPPVGYALDVAFGVADAVSAVSTYQTQSDEYLCALNPADSLAAIEPSMLAVDIAYTSVVLGVLFP